MKSVVFIAPFRHLDGHVGNFRLDRFIHWSARRYKTFLITAGPRDKIFEREFFTEIMIEDPLRLYRRLPDDGGAYDERGSLKARQESLHRRKLGFWLFNPDPTIIWARRVARHKTIGSLRENAHAVISTSPPESCHVASCQVAKKLGCKLIVDLRDGWLDDPLKTYLNKNSLRSWREKRLEKKICSAADAITVTSSEWERLLCGRFPEYSGKITTLTNGYPVHIPDAGENRPGRANRIVLIHAGRFLASRSTQKVADLLLPILTGAGETGFEIEITLIGDLNGEDMMSIEDLKTRHERPGIQISTQAHMDRDGLYEILRTASGYLLLSASRAAVPSKLYDYLMFRKPVFAVTPKDGGLWRLAEDIPQVFRYALAPGEEDGQKVAEFLHACVNPENRYSLPEQFTSECLQGEFLKILE